MERGAASPRGNVGFSQGPRTGLICDRCPLDLKDKSTQPGKSLAWQRSAQQCRVTLLTRLNHADEDVDELLRREGRRRLEVNETTVLNCFWRDRREAPTLLWSHFFCVRFFYFTRFHARTIYRSVLFVIGFIWTHIHRLRAQCSVQSISATVVLRRKRI